MCKALETSHQADRAPSTSNSTNDFDFGWVLFIHQTLVHRHGRPLATGWAGADDGKPIATPILRRKAECEGAQPQTSVRTAQLILAEILPDRLVLSVEGGSENVPVQ